MKKSFKTTKWDISSGEDEPILGRMNDKHTSWGHDSDGEVNPSYNEPFDQYKERLGEFEKLSDK